MTKAKPPASLAASLLPFVFLPKKSFRAIVQEVVDESSEWRTAKAIAIDAKLGYQQTIFALHALHNQGKVARMGRTFKARWGPISLQTPPQDNFLLLSSLFNGSIRRPDKPGIK